MSVTSAHADWTLGVLAGGQSRRMGRDKALLEWADGETLLERIVRRIGPGAAEILISTGAGPRPLPERLNGLRTAVDRVAGAGPLAGIDALLAACRTPWLLVAPCDMPHLGAKAAHRLLAVANEGRADGAHFVRDGRDEPLPVLLRTEPALDAVGAALAAGRFEVRAPWSTMSVCGVPAEGLHPATLTNVNTPEEAAAERARGPLRDTRRR